MATLLMQNHPDTGSNTSRWYYELQYDIIGQNVGANQTTVRFYIVVYSDSSGVTQTGSWVRRGWYPYSGNQIINSTSNPGTISNGHVTLNTADVTVGHDANGNYSAAAGYYLNTPATEMFDKATTLTLPRLALAPSINSITADQISVQSVRLGMEFNNYGHGTSAASRMYYRVNGSGSGYSQTSDQTDGAGFTYWDVTGLTPGTTYEYFTRAYNNNGDTADSGSQTFTTLPPPNTSAALLAIVGVL